MRIAAIADIHGNLPALEAVLRDVEDAGADMIVVGGDLASGPMPRETLERLMALGRHAHFIRGNADRELVDRFDRASDAVAPDDGRDVWLLREAWAAHQITRQQRDFLAALPGTKELEVEGIGRAIFCHGSPSSDEDIITARSPDERLRLLLAGADGDLVVCGHTHMQFDRTVDRTRIVNVGSVGMPYEEMPGAYWALIGAGVTLKRTVYDLSEAADRMRDTGFPGAGDYVSWLFSARPGQEEAIQFFEGLVDERDQRGRSPAP